MSKITIFITPTEKMINAFKSDPVFLTKDMLPDISTLDFQISGLKSVEQEIDIRDTRPGHYEDNSEYCYSLLKTLLSLNENNCMEKANNFCFYQNVMSSFQTFASIISYSIDIKKVIIKKFNSGNIATIISVKKHNYIHNIINFLSRIFSETKMTDILPTIFDVLKNDSIIAIFQLANKTKFNASTFLKNNNNNPKAMRQYLKIILRNYSLYYECDNSVELLNYTFIPDYFKNLIVCNNESKYNHNLSFKYDINKLFKMVNNIKFQTSPMFKKYLKRNISYGHYLLSKEIDITKLKIFEDYAKKTGFKLEHVSDFEYEKWFSNVSTIFNNFKNNDDYIHGYNKEIDGKIYNWIVKKNNDGNHELFLEEHINSLSQTYKENNKQETIQIQKEENVTELINEMEIPKMKITINGIEKTFDGQFTETDMAHLLIDFISESKKSNLKLDNEISSKIISSLSEFIVGKSYETNNYYAEFNNPN